MGRQRSRTLIQQLGFNDPDLRSPAHDALVIWTAENILSFVEKDFDPWRGLDEREQEAKAALQCEFDSYQHELERLLLKASDRTPRQIYVSWDDGTGSHVYRPETPDEIAQRVGVAQDELAQRTTACLGIERLLNSPLPLPKIPEFQIKTIFEQPITTDREFIVGFVDLVAETRRPSLCLTNVRYDNGGRIIGTRGGHPELEFVMVPGSIYLEAKPTIPSLGELLRQIRTYQEYLPNYTSAGSKTRFVVVSPDTRFRKMIEGQGIEFWQSPESL